MPAVRANGIMLGYEVHGDAGPWLLMIQGLGYARWGWYRQLEDFAREFRVIAFDNRGIGESDAPPGPYTLRDMAADAAGLLDALHVERTHVLAASLGGFIAQELALTHPARVDRLVLACTGLAPAHPYPTPEPTLALFGRAEGMAPEDRMRLFVENAFSAAFVREHPEVIEKIVGFRMATAQTWDAWQAQGAASADASFGGRSRGITAQTLVVAGDEDNVVDVRHAELLAHEIPGARLVRMRGGHLFFIEDAERFNPAVARFLHSGEAL